MGFLKFTSFIAAADLTPLSRFKITWIFTRTGDQQRVLNNNVCVKK